MLFYCFRNRRIKKAILDCYNAYLSRYDVLVDGNFNTSTIDALCKTTKTELNDAKTAVNNILKEVDFTQTFDDKETDTVDNKEAENI